MPERIFLLAITEGLMFYQLTVEGLKATEKIRVALNNFSASKAPLGKIGREARAVRHVAGRWGHYCAVLRRKRHPHLGSQERRQRPVPSDVRKGLRTSGSGDMSELFVEEGLHLGRYDRREDRELASATGAPRSTDRPTMAPPKCHRDRNERRRFF